MRTLAFLFTHALAIGAIACSSGGSGAPDDAGSNDANDASGAAAWSTVLSGLDGALLSVWGTSPSNVIAVGGSRGNGFPTLVVRYDGSAWKRLSPGGNDTYWWVYGTSQSDVWMVGENGRTTHFDGSRFADHPSGTNATIYGVWASSPNDAWAVGGTPDSGTGAPNDVVLHWDGSAWSSAPMPQTFGRAYFKVWGASADDVYVVGEAGTVWHRTGGAWALESSPPIASGTLTTVFGCSADEVYAVGGRDVLRRSGGKWAKVDVTLLNDVNGVGCAAPGAVAIVGGGGLKQRLVGGAWSDDFASDPHSDLHAVWADSSGAFWAVGGNFVSGSAPGVSRNGVLARYGSGAVGSSITN